MPPQQHRVPPLCGPTLVHWLRFGAIPPKSPTIKHMFATTKGIGSLVPTTIVHWLNFGDIVCFSILTKDIGCLFFGTHKDNANPKKKPFSRHSNILPPLSHTSHFTSCKLNQTHFNYPHSKLGTHHLWQKNFNLQIPYYLGGFDTIYI